MKAELITGPADLRRQHRLDQLVARLGEGVEAAAEIWANWYEGDRFGDLHPGQSAGQYIASLGYPLTVAEAMAAMPNASTREVAAVAGVSNSTVGLARVRNRTPELPAERVTGADGKSYPAKKAPGLDVRAETVLAQLRDGPKTTTELQVGPIVHAPRQIYTLRQAGYDIASSRADTGEATYNLVSEHPIDRPIAEETAGYRDLLAAFNAVGKFDSLADSIFMSSTALERRRLRLAAHRAARVVREFDLDSAEVVVIGGSNGS